MASELLSSITSAGSGGAYPFPQLPTPNSNDGYISYTTNKIPHNGTLVDNIEVPSAFNVTGTGDWEGYLGETLVWSVGADDLNAACDGFAGIQACNYDSTNDRLYVLGIDTGTTPDTYYLAYITLETGAVTNVGNAQFGTDLTGITSNLNINISRGAVSSGNFTVKSENRTVVINESTGAEVSNSASTNALTGFEVGTYTTLDGTIMLYRNLQDTGEASGFIDLIKNGEMIRVASPQPLLGPIDAGLTQNALPWGDKVKILASTSVNNNSGLLRTFTRSEFDQWLQDVAKFGGVD